MPWVVRNEPVVGIDFTRLCQELMYGFIKFDVLERSQES